MNGIIRSSFPLYTFLRSRWLTLVPTSTAGLMPSWNRRESRTICPSVIEIRLVGM